MISDFVLSSITKNDFKILISINFDLPAATRAMSIVTGAITVP